MEVTKSVGTAVDATLVTLGTTVDAGPAVGATADAVGASAVAVGTTVTSAAGTTRGFAKLRFGGGTRTADTAEGVAADTAAAEASSRSAFSSQRPLSLRRSTARRGSQRSWKAMACQSKID